MFGLISSFITRRTQISPGSSALRADPGLRRLLHLGGRDPGQLGRHAGLRDPRGPHHLPPLSGFSERRHRLERLVHPWTPLGGTAIQLAVETGSDGRGVMVAIREDGSLFQRKMLHPNAQGESEWGLPYSRSTVRSTPSTWPATSTGRLVIFGIDVDGRLFQRFETAPGSGTWQPWSQIATQIGTTPTTPDAPHRGRAERPGRIELFAVDATGMLYHPSRATRTPPPGPPGRPLWFPAARQSLDHPDRPRKRLLDRA